MNSKLRMEIKRRMDQGDTIDQLVKGLALTTKNLINWDAKSRKRGNV